MKKFLVTTVLSLSMVLGFSAFALAEQMGAPDSTGTSATGETIGTGKATTDAKYDNGAINKNNTGVGIGGQSSTNVDKDFQSLQGQRTHGEYQNNTNSCASCHQTHTAAAENLLFKDGVFTTCTACHDGTLGVLNVFEGSTAGTFGGTDAGNASMHMPTGAMRVKAAPGGNTTASDTDANWGAEFTCSSCHSPHGSFSDRLLSYNPNGVGITPMYFTKKDSNGNVIYTEKDLSTVSATPVKTGGLQVNEPVIAGTAVPAAAPVNAVQQADGSYQFPIPAAFEKEYIVVKTTTDSTGAAGIKIFKQDGTTPAEANGTQVIVLMKRNAANNDKGTKSDASDDVTTYSYVRDVNPWINNHAGGSRATWTQFYDSTGANVIGYDNAAKKDIDYYDVNLSLAYAKPTTAGNSSWNNIVSAKISRATVVKFDFLATNQGTFNGLPVKQVDIASYSKKGYGIQVSQFCAACHTDYLATAGKETGVWSQAFRHNTTSDTYTCLKCHFAHGTDVDVMLDADDNSVDSLVASGAFGAIGTTEEKAAAKLKAEDYMLDKNPSSAIKRYTNMSVCWKCHTSSHSEGMINNEWFSGDVDSTVKGSTEFGTAGGSNVPAGWVDPTQSKLPYYNHDKGDGVIAPYALVNPEGSPSNPEQ